VASPVRVNESESSGTEVSKRVLEIDQVRGLAMISVIVLHTLPPLGPLAWTNALIFAQCVPIFFMLMGLNAIRSYRRRLGCVRVSLGESYQRGRVRRNLLRLVIPFGILWVFSLAVGLLYGDAHFGPLLFIGYLPHTGPGNYFVVIAIVFVLIAPFLCWAYVRWPILTVLGLVGIDLVFELAAPYIPVFDAPFVYSACILRYGSAIALGLWIADDERFVSRRNWFVIPYGVAGFLYIVLALAADVAPPFRPNWGTQNLLSFGWALVMMLALLKLLRRRPLRAGLSSRLAVIGRSSYGIYVFQIAWFSLGLQAFVLPEQSPRLAPVAHGAVLLLLLAVNLVVCLVVGVWWQRRILEPLDARLNA
jgi:peptidoglycan/LPS O-acetylase OafA/YrhL